MADATRPHGGPDRFSVQGPAVRLPPSLALSLALALHELSTNASKYGSLSNESGSVVLSWDIRDPTGEPRLLFRWVEVGGPPVKPPTRRGFGTRLIERSLSADIGGTVTVDYKAEGLLCVIEVPLRIQAPSLQATNPD